MTSIFAAFFVATSSRILLLCNSYPPEIGAAPLRMQGMAHLLRDAGYEVAVLSGMPNYPTGRVFPAYKDKSFFTEQVAGIQVCRIPFTPSHSASRLRRSSSLLSLSGAFLRYGGDFIKKFCPDRMIISSPPLPLALCGALLARRARVPFLLNVSDLWPLTAKELGALREGPLYHVLQQAEGWLFRQAQGWMGQSEEILRYMQTRISGNKPFFLYRNLPFGKPTVMRTVQGSPSRSIVYAGLIGPVQGILEVARQVNFAHYNLELHLYGDGVDRSALEDFIFKNPGRGVFYKGLLAPEEMFRKFREYDFAFASLRTAVYGAVPSKIFAAFAAGLPVIFMGGGEGASLVRKHNAGWVLPSGDSKALGQQLEALGGYSAAAWRQLHEHILEQNARYFDAGRQGADFIDFFRKTASFR